MSAIALWAFMALAVGCASSQAPAEALRFRTHNLATDCYSASEMKVRYGNRLYGACGQPAREKRPEDDRRLPSVIIEFRAFEGPLQVDWRSRDGTVLSHTIRLE